jgi:hypothetical protein
MSVVMVTALTIPMNAREWSPIHNQGV